MSRDLHRGNPAKNIGANPPSRKVALADGTVREEKLNPMKAKNTHSRKMVDPDGNVVTISLATGYAVRQSDNHYGGPLLAAKLKAGFLCYDECPIATGRVPAGPKDKACAGTFSREKACEHIEAIIKARRAVKQKKEADIAKSYATNQDKMVRLFEQQLALSKPEEKRGESPLGR